MECRAEVDCCWRWCPECGSLDLEYPTGTLNARWADEFSVEWEMDEEAVADGLERLGDRSSVGSTA